MKFLNFNFGLNLNRRRILAIGLTAFISGVLLSSILLSLVQIPPFTASGQPLLRFSSYQELVDFVEDSRTGYLTSEDSRTGSFSFDSAATSVIPDYSTTNIQVEEVDEADIVKTDGEYLYVVSNQSVFILRASPDNLEILSQLRLNGTLNGIFINGNKLVVFGSSDYGSVFVERSVSIFGPGYSSPPKTFIRVFDISNRSSPISTRNVTQDGSYLNSRMIGNYVYAVINEAAWVNDGDVKLPVAYSNDQFREIPATEIYYSNITDYGYTFTTIVAINLKNDAEQPTYKTILVGATRRMYVSLDNMYITLPRQQDAAGVERTLIYRIHLEESSIEVEANGEVPGRVLNQFSMDEYDGYFRIATTTGSLWSGTSRNHVYVLNMSLGITGRLEGLARGERIYSARFMGDEFYLVTFRKVDPLFVIDLQDPENPSVLGELKVTGYSDYLHPYDENHVIGVGKETVAAEKGDFSWYQGVKISLFNVSDVLNPEEIDKDEIGDRGTDSPVLTDHKAFLFEREKQLLVIPVLVAEIDEAKYPSGVPPNAYGDHVWQGAYVYKITLEGLELRGNITHIEDGTDLQSSYYHYSPYSVTRALYIDNVLYTISDKKIKMNSLETLEEIGEILLP